MRQIILSIFLCFYVVAFSAKLTVTGNYLMSDKITGNDTVTVILFDSISSTSEITYSGTGTTINWYEYNDRKTSISSQSTYYPDNATGYILVVDGDTTNIWVIDYLKNKPHFYSFEAEKIQTDPCGKVTLLLDAKVPDLYYKTPKGDSITIPRYFTIKYQTLQWPANWTIPIDTLVTLTLPSTYPISVLAPLCDTKFTLSGDQYTDKDSFNLTPDTITSSKYTAVVVQCHPTSTVTTRPEINEAERPSQASQISGSAPLDMEFLSNANEPVARYYKWVINKNKQLWNTRSGLDKEQRYTFTEAGTYNLKLLVSNNDHCPCTDSTITITVSESQIQVPNVFTPNGDGVNDEFRIAYKSILTFDCWVYNRWGRLVYHWTDPQKGWDGNINGREATPGPYFYVIKALGSDYDPNSKPIGKTKLRLGEYLLKGDINLLR